MKRSSAKMDFDGQMTTTLNFEKDLCFAGRDICFNKNFELTFDTKQDV